MGTLSKFLGKPKDITINGEILTIHPLKVKDMELFSKQQPTEAEIKKMSTEIIRLSIPGATAEEIEGLDMDTFVKIMGEINTLNGFKDERLESIKARITQANKQ